MTNLLTPAVHARELSTQPQQWLFLTMVSVETYDDEDKVLGVGSYSK